MHTYRRTAVAVALVAALSTGTAACDAGQRAMDCARLAGSIASSVEQLTLAAGDAADAEDMSTFTDAIEKETQKIKDDTGDADIAAAADSVLEAVENVRESMESDENPDLGPLGDAAGELTAVCTPG